MKVVDTTLEGVKVLEPQVYGDERGFFMETFNAQTWDSLGLPKLNFVQDNHSCSSKGVLRGLHFQEPNSQGKLIRVVSGSVFDVCVDVRPQSKTFGKCFSIELSAKNKKILWLPPGFAHGFLTLEDATELVYKCTDYYCPSSERTLKWDDPSLNINWPALDCSYLTSEKDKKGLSWSQLFES
ncbi:MAG: dTDP-4-dehydrorhamnose 3,5-epimerase [Lentisphaeraceae bacterium]|nr:dTDP-4-dehydrorhamnose 3,5-epimerase [Lentisphaeraceae bacterium]